MKKNIVVYTRNDCVYCEKTKEYLNKLNLEYQIIDITHWDKKQREDIKIKYNVKTVPIIVIDGKLIGGYNDLIHQLHLV